MTYKGAIEEPEGQRNFRGFDYRVLFANTGDSLSNKKSKRFNLRFPSKRGMFFDWLSQWRRQAIVWSKGALSAADEPVYDRPSFGYLDTDFEEMDQLYTSLGIIHLFALSGMQVGFFHQWDSKGLLRLGILQETVDIWMVPISLVYAGLTGFSVSVVRSLLQRSSLKRGSEGWRIWR